MKRSKTITENLFHNLQNQTVILSFYDNLLGIAIRDFIEGVDLTLALKCHYSPKTKELTLDLKIPNSYAIATIKETNNHVVFNIAEPRLAFYSLKEFANMRGITHFNDKRFLLVSNRMELITCESLEMYKHLDKTLPDHETIRRIQNELVGLFYRQKVLKEIHYQTVYQPLFYMFLLKNGIPLLDNYHYMGLTNVAIELNKKEYEGPFFEKTRLANGSEVISPGVSKRTRQANGMEIISPPVIDPEKRSEANRFFNPKMVMEYYPTFTEFQSRIFKLRCKRHREVLDVEVVLFENGVFHFAQRKDKWAFENCFELEKGDVLLNYMEVNSDVRWGVVGSTRARLENYPFLLTDIKEAQRFIRILEKELLNKLTELLEDNMEGIGADKDKETLRDSYQEFMRYLAAKQQDFI